MALNGIPRQLIQIPIINRQQPGIMAIKVEHRQPVTVDIAFDGLPDLPDKCCRVLDAINGACAVDGLSPRPRIGLFNPHKKLIVGFIDPDIILTVFERETVDDDNCGGSPFVVSRINALHRDILGATAFEMLVKFFRVLD
jgi:hypothetical protein